MAIMTIFSHHFKQQKNLHFGSVSAFCLYMDFLKANLKIIGDLLPQFSVSQTRELTWKEYKRYKLKEVKVIN